MSDALFRALAAGATVVTPNRRLARHLVEHHDRAQRSAGRLAWPSAQVLPWTAWTVAMQDEAIAAGATPVRVPLAPTASRLLWRAAIAADGVEVPDADALADVAADAWELIHAYGAGGASWRGWKEGADEPAAFARWADRYEASLRSLGASDAALAPEIIARAATDVPAWRGRPVVLAGFLEPTPQQRRVADALVRAGATVESMPTHAAASAAPARASFASRDDELAAAFGWARRHVEARPGATIGIVVPDLAARRASVRLRAIDAFGSQGDGSAPAWNLSLGAPIDDVPLVAAAIDLSTLAWTALPAPRAAALFRAAHLPGAFGPHRLARAAVQRRWLQEGIESLRLPQAIASLRATGDPLAERFADAARISGGVTRATRHAWVDAWRSLWAAAGWPGDRALSSDELQAMRALDEHLAAFAALDAVAGDRGRVEVGSAEAMASFGAMLATSPFQPETPAAPIQILGLYEAVGLGFDALWVSGMDDETLPRASRPHPFLPLAWQREHGVPRSDASRELRYARDVAATLEGAAPEVVVSYAMRIDDRPMSPSAVFRGDTVEPARAPIGPSRAMHDARPVRERLIDEHAPALAPGTRVGGAGVIQAQSDCAFQALAAYRWRADRWPESAAGPTPLERGNLAHATLAAFWRDVGDHASLVALLSDRDRYRAACDAAAESATEGDAVESARWRRLPRAVRALESGRLANLLDEWLVKVEAGRRPFTAADLEHKLALDLGPLALSLRLDRVDRLASGGAEILDYKTGRVPSIKHWRGERPEAAQLALYTLAWKATHADVAVRGVALAQLRRGETQAIGLYADADARLGKASTKNDKSIVDDWPGLEAEWSASMIALAEAHARGDAAVAPRQLALCRHCARQSLCRIGAVADDADEGLDP